MRQYYSNNKNYNAILESMAQIRENQLNEAYGGMPHHGGGMSGAMDRMAQGQIPLNAEAMHGDEEEMEEGMYEGEHEDEEDAQMEALAEMMDEALMELDQDDDDDQMLGEEEEDGERRARRRARLRNALLIGAGLVATGGLGAAAAMGKLPGAAGQQTMKAIGDAAGGVVTKAGEYIAPKLTAAGEALSGGMDSVTGAASGAMDDVSAAYEKGKADALRSAEKLYHGGKTRYNLATKGRQNMYDNPFG
jgi:hypothetical protein